MEFSIGGYSIDNYTVTGEDTYTINLLKNGIKVATVENMGEGFIDVTFAPPLEGKTEEYYAFVLSDMYRLLLEFEPILEESGAYKKFVLSQYSAVFGFVELLLDLKGIVEAYKEVPKKEEFSDFYIVGAMGNSYFKNVEKAYPRRYFWKFTLTHDLYEADKTLRAYASRNQRMQGDLVAGAILSGVMDWNLSFQDFGVLYRP